MSFRLFIYYCAICGAWAALIAFLLVVLTGLNKPYQPSDAMLEKAVQAEDMKALARTIKWMTVGKLTLAGGLLGLLLGAAVGTLDALLNSVGSQRIIRPLICLGVGMLGAMLGACVGEMLYQFPGLPRFPGWMLAGMAIGFSIGVFDVLRAVLSGSGMSMAVRKVMNGVIGGLMGGLVGGILFDVLSSDTLNNMLFGKPAPVEGQTDTGEGMFTRTSLALGLVILGACIGLLIGLAQVILKEAWVRVESGFKAGRELILSKAETSIGRAESCDIGLYGDNNIEKLHARIQLKGNRYLLADDDTPGGTFLNGERIQGPTPLRSGDRIGVGRAVLRFGERQKR